MTPVERLGLQGPFQVHDPPVLLVVDERAHQVVPLSPEHATDTLAHFLRRYPADTPCRLLTADAVRETPLAAARPPGTLVVPAQSTENPGGLGGLTWVVDRLLGPGGCPWDRAQTHESLKRHLIEEAYELLDAIDSGDPDQLREELGDVLLQPVMHAQMERRDGRWGIDEVAASVTEKLVRRHPHVFGDVHAPDADTVLRNWDAIKKAEKGDQGQASILDGVPRALPALLRAFEVSKRAARVGFEWPDLEGVWSKLAEEERELREAIASGEGVADELGDLLFTVVNLARWTGVEPEDALRTMLDRFTARFQAMERGANRPLGELSAAEWDALWVAAKARP